MRRLLTPFFFVTKILLPFPGISYHDFNLNDAVQEAGGGGAGGGVCFLFLFFVCEVIARAQRKTPPRSLVSPHSHFPGSSRKHASEAARLCGAASGRCDVRQFWRRSLCEQLDRRSSCLRNVSFFRRFLPFSHTLKLSFSLCH